MEWLDWILKLIPPFSGIILLIIGGKINSKLEKRKNDYSLYNEKRHIHYSEAFRLLKIAEGHNLDMNMITSSLTLDDHNTEDLEEYLKKFMTKKQISIVSELWENGEYQKAKEIINKDKKNSDDKVAYEKIVEASNYFHENELYFKVDTFNLLIGYTGSLFEVFYSKQSGNSITIKTKALLSKKLNKIKISMQDDLSIVGTNKKKKK